MGSAIRKSARPEDDIAGQASSSSIDSTATNLAARISEESGGAIVRIQSRQVNKDAITEQRSEARKSLLSERDRSKTRVALQNQETVDGQPVRSKKGSFLNSLRMSRMGTLTKDQMIKKVEEANSPKSDMRDLSLDKRLDTFGLQSEVMEGDGNCQFRSIAFNLFGDQKHHAVARKAAVEHMKKHADFFGIFFETPQTFKAYLKDMATNRTWGDELTLRATVEAYRCVAHVITSEPANWHLVYEPEDDGDESRDPKIASCPKGIKMPPVGKTIFLCYVSPVHYNAIVRKPQQQTLTE
eukprot:TRINITY_DN40124_c0_g1_i1.p1 TRINITY_DN40124_c0_g1~~TRINITY_DN40124_c0_g1_i1.p1  ORF type:complete len:297 (+),score=52.87 TRINITY_DN40124_c0_g1_i1:55-945(+)